MSGLSRYVEVLRLFSEVKSDWTVPEIALELDVPASTVYRTVRELVAEEFLAPSIEAHYRLGSAFVEFDRLIRLTDPLVRVGTTLMREAVVQARTPCVAFLARLYGDTVMSVADATSSDASIKIGYERGLPRPLTRGATSKMILAQLPTRRLKRLLQHAAEGEAGSSSASSAEDLHEQLIAARRSGYSVTRGEVDEGLVGIAAPVSMPERGLIASFTLVVSAAAISDESERRLVLLAVSTASLVKEELGQLDAAASLKSSS